MRSQQLALLAATSTSVVGQTQYTATSASDVYAAQATALTLSPTSDVKGKAFDRLAIIWLENTDYDLAAGDREFGSFPSPAYGSDICSLSSSKPPIPRQEGHYSYKLLWGDPSLGAQLCGFHWRYGSVNLENALEMHA